MDSKGFYRFSVVQVWERQARRARRELVRDEAPKHQRQGRTLGTRIAFGNTTAAQSAGGEGVISVRLQARFNSRGNRKSFHRTSFWTRLLIGTVYHLTNNHTARFLPRHRGLPAPKSILRPTTRRIRNTEKKAVIMASPPLSRTQFFDGIEFTADELAELQHKWKVSRPAMFRRKRALLRQEMDEKREREEFDDEGNRGSSLWNPMRDLAMRRGAADARIKAVQMRRGC